MDGIPLKINPASVFPFVLDWILSRVALHFTPPLLFFSGSAAKELIRLPLHCPSQCIKTVHSIVPVVSCSSRQNLLSVDQNWEGEEEGWGDLRMRFLSGCTCSNNKPPLLLVSLLVSPVSVYLQIKTYNYRSQVSASNLTSSDNKWP